ncbi:hypothetical protein CR205_01830 [Alteribacter lacisalsi]|uniref:DUF1516 family protein n=1 Tax=Alteribacter lacisalsi TaxID=2045244 RepID=A0A2W0HUN3_9BACI|nr:DUF1516 family protein [Alteribacter lacisalsi]PYZ97368.1 hypothetical protein CR205_01830 [Alteribacter lacisalsi]
MNYTAMLHTHTLAWFVMLILFAVTIILLRSGKAKGGKIVQMTLRLFYIFVLVSGGTLLIMNPYWATVVKGILAVLLIFTMERISTGTKKGTLQGSQPMVLWTQFAILSIIVIYFGYFVT